MASHTVPTMLSTLLPVCAEYLPFHGLGIAPKPLQLSAFPTLWRPGDPGSESEERDQGRTAVGFEPGVEPMASLIPKLASLAPVHACRIPGFLPRQQRVPAVVTETFSLGGLCPPNHFTLILREGCVVTGALYEGFPTVSVDSAIRVCSSSIALLGDISTCLTACSTSRLW